ncbi:MAG: transporter [Amoebophilaceae bacterium TMED152]|nr:transporter [Gammaproteobacteria bacterium]RPH02215.1 MAG: transporter [Amoebophilaceae bacterium TMED152]|tara:strand:+ start:6209 stop:8476 length:2268 start_codon:yes stop_codon:yes gene_type:complete
MVQDFFQKIINHKYLCLLGLFLLLGTSLLGLNNFRFDASSETLVLDSDVNYQIYDEINDEFGTSEYVILAIKNDQIFSQETLIQLKAVQDKLLALEVVSDVVSILDAPIFEQPKVSLIKSADNDKYLLTDKLDLDKAKHELSTSPIFNELIISKDGEVTAMQINLYDRDDYSEAVAEIRAIIDSNQTFEMYLAGPAMIVVDTIDFIKADVNTFGTLTVIIFFILLTLFFRDLWSVSVVILNAGLVMFSTMGILGLFDWPISIVSSNFLTLLLITSIAISIHILVKVQDGVEEGITNAESFSKIITPCFYAALTTAVGFLSLILSDIKPVIDFGKMMAVGVCLNFFASFIFIPSALAIRNITANKNKSLVPFFYNNIYLTGRSFIRKFYLPILLISFPLFFYFSSNLKVENKFIDYFNENTEIYQGMSLIDDKLGGTTPIEIILELPEEELFIDEDDLFFSEGSETVTYWWREKNMNVLEEIQEGLTEFDALGKALSLVNGVQLAERLNNDSEIGDLELAFVKNSLIESEKAKDLLNEFISEDERSARITIRTIDSFDGINRKQLLLDVDSFLSETLSERDVSYTVSGLGVLYSNLLQSLFSSQIKTISLVFAAIFLMLLILFRSFLNALFIIIVPAFSIGLVLSLMSIFNIPLDIMTITIASISVGMSVDYSIHFAWRYLQERKKSQESSEKETIYSTGRAILITGLTIIVGFLIFIFSNFNPTVLFGIFSAIAIYISMVMSFRFLPALLDLNFK